LTRLNQGLLYGPIALVGKSSQTTNLPVSLYGSLPLSGDLAGAVSPAEQPMTFSTNGIRFEPFYLGNPEPYHAYSGVENKVGDEGRTFLDIVWSKAPFKTVDDVRGAVNSTSVQWANDGLLTADEAAAIKTTAKAAPISRS
jgi:uncharacterized protein